MRLAIIDCGTNTFNLLIVDTEGPGKTSKVFNTRIPVKLGEGAINKGFIGETPFLRGVEAMEKFKAYAHDFCAEKILVFATSAIRDASNGKEFVERCEKLTGLTIQVIDGNREAELIYLGNRAAVDLNGDTSLIMDIGGGSTEFILGNNSAIHWKKSYPLGAARLLEKFFPGSPISSEEEASMRLYLRESLDDLFQAVKAFPVYELIGSSGAFDSIVEMINGELNGEPLTDEKISYEVNLRDYREISSRVKQASLEERKKIKGLTPMRFDMIVISCVMIDFILEELQLEKMRVSTYSLKEGALIDFLNKHSK